MNNILQRSYMIIALAVLCSAGMVAQTYTSVGNGEWNTPATWDQSAVPGASNDVVIASGHAITLTTTAGTCANLLIASGGSLSINTSGLAIPGTSWSLDPASTVIFSGPTTVQSAPTYGNLEYKSANGGPNGNLTVTGNLINSGTGSIRGIATTSGSYIHTVSGDVLLTNASAKITGVNNSAATTASCTWNIAGSVKLTGNSSSNRIILYESAGPHNGSAIYNIDGNIEIGAGSQIMYKSSSGTSNDYSAGTINLKGNLIQNGTIGINSITSGTVVGLTINFIGTSQQTWSGTGTFSVASASSVTMNINNAAGVTLNGPRTMNTSTILTLTNGKLTTDATNLLTFSGTGTINGGSSSSFINGPMAHTWSTATETKLYPLGKGSAYRPLEISLTTPTSPVISAEVFNANAGGTSVLSTISTVRYYQTSLVSGTATGGGSVKITYGADDGVSNSANLVVAQSTAATGTYSDIGMSANDASSVTSGTSYNPASGDFLLIGSTGGNALPVEMASFTASMQNANSAVLRWSTATEVNNLGFEVERRADGSSTWIKVGYVAGAATSSSPKDYSFQDASLAPGVYIYRIKQIDNDGTFRYSASTQVDAGVSKGFELLSNYPNPFNPETNIRFSVPENGFATLKVFNMLGQEVATLFSGMATAGHYIPATFNAGGLASGVYFSRLDFNGKSIVQRMLMTK